MYFAAINGQRKGPYSEAQLRGLIQDREVTAQTLVWREGMAAWTPLTSVPELAHLLSALPTDPSSLYAAPAAPANVPYTGQRIPNYLWQAILVTLLCCIPFGIPAIIYASQVDGLAAQGDFAGAQRASRLAKIWCWVAFLPMAIFWLLYIGFIVLMLLGLWA